MKPHEAINTLQPQKKQLKVCIGVHQNFTR